MQRQERRRREQTLRLIQQDSSPQHNPRGLPKMNKSRKNMVSSTKTVSPVKKRGKRSHVQAVNQSLPQIRPDILQPQLLSEITIENQEL